MSYVREGTILDGQYRLDRLLGVGGVGAVYAARHLVLERDVAIKVLHPQFAAHHESVQRFLREARLLAKLEHPSVLKVDDFSFAADGTAYLVMELLAGETLRTRLLRGPLPVVEVVALFRPMCEALEQAHGLHILHRDLKPDNLMLTEGGVKILDFGMAKLISEDNPLTADKVVMGTPYYLAPERARGQAGVDHRSDLFALGAILYEALSGKMAFYADTPVAAMYKIVQAPVPRLELPDAELARRLDQVIAKACAKDPADRFATAGELLRALEAAAHSAAGVQARPAARDEPAQVRSMTRHASGGVVKAAVFHTTLQFIRHRFGEDGFQRVAEAVGPGQVQRIADTLPTEWISMNEMNELLTAMSQVLGGGGLEICRDLGSYVAETTLDSIYKAFLNPGDPEVLIQRLQVIFDVTVSGRTQAKHIGEGRWRLEFHDMESLTHHFLAAQAGWMESYLEKGGARNVEVHEDIEDRAGRVVGNLTIKLDVPAQ